MAKRQSNFELLRILSMVLVISHHFAVHGGFVFYAPEVSGNVWFLQLLSVGGKLGVNFFVMISGYFLITTRGFNWRKAAKLWLQIFFYSVVIYAIACGTGLTSYSPNGLLRACLPVLSKQWWFASAYFVLYLVSPGINWVLGKLKEKAFRWVLIVVGFFWCVVPVLVWLPERTRDTLWFVYLYALAGYLRLYTVPGSCKKWMALGLAALVLAYGSVMYKLLDMAAFAVKYEILYLNMFDPLALLTTLFLFRGFAALDLGYRPRINQAATVTFGIYLIHDSDFFRYPLWRDLARCADFADSGLLIPYAVFMTIAVYLVCGGLEALRARCFAIKKKEAKPQ